MSIWMRPCSWLRSVPLDVRYGFRTLAQSPGLTLVIALTLALGVGVNAAIFNIVNGFLLRPMPVPSPDQVTVLAIAEKGSPIGALGFSYLEFADFREESKDFCDVFGQALGFAELSADGQAEQLTISAVSNNYFSGLGVKPGIGRLISASEAEHPDDAAVIVLGYSWWQRKFGGDPGVVGKQVRFNGKPATVIGIVPQEFRGSFSAFEMDGYVPLSAMYSDDAARRFWIDRNIRAMMCMGRLHESSSLVSAQSALDVISARLARQHPASDAGITVRIMPERMARPIPYANNAFRLIAGLFLILALLILVLSGTNVVNILMSRAATRQHEIAIRAALGAGRGRLVREMLTESSMLLLLGGAGGVALGKWISQLAGLIRVQGLPLHLDSAMDWRVYGYSLAAVGFTGLFVGVLPALSATRVNLNAALRQDASRGAPMALRHRVRGDLMVAQIAGALAMLIVCGLFLRSLSNAQHMDLGFDADNVLNVTLDPSMNGYDTVRTKDFYRKLEARVRAIPGVRSASLSSSVPIGTFPFSKPVYVQGAHSLPDQQSPRIRYSCVDSDYFATMRIPLLRGRAFTDFDDEAAAPAVIINQTMASRFWPGQDPLGKQFSLKSDEGPFLEVVGVTRDGKYGTLAEDPQPYFYLPLAQNYVSRLILQLRTNSGPQSASSEVQREIQSLDPALPIEDMRTMKQALQGGTGLFIFGLGASLAGCMGGVALILAITGVYGVVSYSAAQRTKEIGVRRALGAGSGGVLRLILGQGLRLVAMGVLIGVPAAFVITRLMAHLLIGVSASDPLTYAAATIVLSTVALLACWIPARRATLVDPMEALRNE
jgi:predicted permease